MHIKYPIFHSLFFLSLLFSSSFVIAQNRSIDGVNTNLDHPEWGAVSTNQLIASPIGFADGMSSPAGPDRPNAREISNALFAQEGLIMDQINLSDYAWVWGQFIDHDITLVGEDHNDAFDIEIPMGDVYFDPNSTGAMSIPFARSTFEPGSGTSMDNPRAFPNEITAFLDGSGVYGSDNERARWLRTFEDGKLKTSKGNMLPYNTLNGEIDGDTDDNTPFMAMAGNPHATRWFVAGDVRANENILLTSMHTLFVREHNRLCTKLRGKHTSWTDQELYQRARKMVGAMIQKVVYDEWLPTMGVDIPDYSGYNNTVNPGIMNVFSAAAYRYGHTVISSDILRLQENGQSIPQGNITLREAFFQPQQLIDGGGVDPLLRGVGTTVEQDFDTKIIDDLRNFLFGAPGQGGLDLAAMNIQRGRERGLADYNSIRQAFDLAPITKFSELSSDPDLVDLFEQTYSSVDDIDPWVGFLAEDHMQHSLFGHTVMKIMQTQFQNLRDGDRFYYKNDPNLEPYQLEIIESSSLANIIIRNTGVQFMQDNVFLAQPMIVANQNLLDLETSIDIYPNPSEGRFTIDFTGFESDVSEVSIHSITGSKVYSTRVEPFNQEVLFDGSTTQNLKSGIYIVTIVSESNRHSERLIIK